MEKKKRCYWVDCDDENYGYAVVANSAKEAKNIAWRNDGGHNDIFYDTEFIDVRVKWKKDIDVSKFEIGIIDILEGLKIGAYGYAEGFECPHCGDDEYISSNEYDGKIFVGCISCQEKHEESLETKTDQI